MTNEYILLEAYSTCKFNLSLDGIMVIPKDLYVSELEAELEAKLENAQFKKVGEIKNVSSIDFRHSPHRGPNGYSPIFALGTLSKSDPKLTKEIKDMLHKFGKEKKLNCRNLLHNERVIKEIANTQIVKADLYMARFVPKDEVFREWTKGKNFTETYAIRPEEGPIILNGNKISFPNQQKSELCSDFEFGSNEIPLEFRISLTEKGTLTLDKIGQMEVTRECLKRRVVYGDDYSRPRHYPSCLIMYQNMEEMVNAISKFM